MAKTPRRTMATAAFALALALVCAGCVALGLWQLQRLGQKEALQAVMDSRIHAAPVQAPGPAEWPDIAPDRDAFRRVTVDGTAIAGRQVLVQAVTDLGPGFWLLVPVTSKRGTILVNLGFVPQDQADAFRRGGTAALPVAVHVTGLIRMPEPGGAFLRSNDPAADRWFSRDVAAIAAAKNLGPVAPYFVDAEKDPSGPALPVAGLTVTALPNNHLAYALTWFALALMALSGCSFIIYEAYIKKRIRLQAEAEE